ncbi:MAG: hypothetical protein AAFZ65_09695 [Planctomycetota bacterium]
MEVRHALPLLGLTLLACAPSGSKERVTYYPDGAVWSRGEVEGGRAHGLWRTWHPNGQLASEGSYLGGIEHGRWAEYAADGTPLGERTYDAGQLEGPWLRCYPDGTPESRGEFYEGLRAGDWTDFHANGAVRSLGPYRTGRTHGIWRSFREDGSFEALQSFDQDVADGPYARFGPDEQPLLVGEYDQGTPSGHWWTWNEAGVLVTFARRGASTGDDTDRIQLTTLHPNGTVASDGLLVNSVPSGSWRHWLPTGALDADLSGEYVDGARVAPLPEGIDPTPPTVPEPRIPR